MYPTQLSTNLEETIPLVLPPSEQPCAFSARWLDSVDQLEAIETQWRQLSEQALLRNGSLEPNFLIPAFRHLNAGSARVLVVEGKTDSQDRVQNTRPPICGVVALAPTRFYRLPIPCMESWMHDQSVDSTPLLRRDCATEVLRSMFQFLAGEGIGLASFKTVSAEPPFQQVIEELSTNRNYPLFQRNEFQRSAFVPETDAECYLRKHTSSNLRKSSKRSEKQLAKLGRLEINTSDHGSDYEELAEQFLVLESSGWKGNSGTALACKDSSADFYRELVRRSAQEGTARFLTITLDGRPIAMVSDFQTGRTVFSFKTTYDEQFARYSPGRLAELKNTEWLNHCRLSADSCSEPDNPTMNRIWGQQLRFQSLVIGLQGGGMPKIAIRMMPSMQKLANLAKAARAKLYRRN